MNAKTKSNPTETRQSIKLGIDAHAKWFHVGRQLDWGTPQPVQKMTFDGLLRFVDKQQSLAREVFTCCEAGVFGYHFHCKLTAMSVTNYVAQAQGRGRGERRDKPAWNREWKSIAEKT